MGARKWRPGDVALVLNKHGVWNRAICSVKPGGDVWQYGVADSTAPMGAEARLLVVLDPEDRESVAVLRDALDATQGIAVAHVQIALRSLIVPSKPDEPTGLGAVIETDTGERWVRRAGDGSVWMHAEGNAFSQRWRNLDAVKVLSEGVSS